MLEEKVDLPAPASLDLGIGSAALVYDNSFFGATSPILGQRYRLEVSPTVGSLNYVSVLAGLPPLLHAGSAVYLRHPVGPLWPLCQ